MIPENNHRKLCKTTGTTIAGCIVVETDSNGATQKQYTMLAADTCATDNMMVADKRCSKIHPLASNCWCCGAGTSGDLDKMTRNVLYSMSMNQLQSATIGNGNDIGPNEKGKDLNPMQILYQQGYNDVMTTDNDADGPSDREALIYVLPISIPTICRIFQDVLFDANGSYGANLIVGGVWEGEAYLRAIHLHRSMDIGLPFSWRWEAVVLPPWLSWRRVILPTCRWRTPFGWSRRPSYLVFVTTWAVDHKSICVSYILTGHLVIHDI
jgi:hypothetical protein